MDFTRRRGWWRSFWFADERAENLAAFRIVVATHSLWLLLSRDYAAISSVPSVFRQSVPDGVRWRYLLFEGLGPVDVVIQWTAIVTLVLVLFGVFPRVCCLLAAVAVYHLAPLETVMWTASPKARGLTMAPVALALLAFSRSGDALSIWPKKPAAGPSWEYGWPLKVVALLVVQIYLFSAIGKLSEAGLSWGSGANMRAWLLWFSLATESSVFSALGLFLADRPVLCTMIGYGTVLFEWAMPLILFFPRLVAPLVTIAVAFHLASLFAMNIYVGEAWYLLVFVDWTGLRRWLGAEVPSPAPA